MIILGYIWPRPAKDLTFLWSTVLMCYTALYVLYMYSVLYIYYIVYVLCIVYVIEIIMLPT